MTTRTRTKTRMTGLDSDFAVKLDCTTAPDQEVPFQLSGLRKHMGSWPKRGACCCIIM